MLYLCQEWPREERIPAVSCIPREAREDFTRVLRWLQELPEAEGFYDESLPPQRTSDDSGDREEEKTRVGVSDSRVHCEP